MRYEEQSEYVRKLGTLFDVKKYLGGKESLFEYGPKVEKNKIYF